jgi:hypothetical protein
MINTARVAYFFRPEDEPGGGEGSGRPSSKQRESKREDLPYRVELWDLAKASVEEVLAVTRSASIGYAAFYAATREYPSRYLTLSDKNGVVNRWNGPVH